jgi:flagellar protein FliS
MEQSVVRSHSPQSKLAAYRSVIAHGAVADDHPHALVLTLFDAALERLRTARACIERGEARRKASLLHSAVILVAELRGSLDTQRGGELADNLSELYGYVTRRLIHANLNSDSAALAEVMSLLGEIRSAWAAIGQQVGPRAAPLASTVA